MDYRKMNHFQNARVIGDDVSPEHYRSQLTERGDVIQRGDARYVMSRSDLMEFQLCQTRWLAGGGGSPRDTESTEWGALIDTLVQGCHAFNARYNVLPKTYPSKKSGEGDKPWNRNAHYCQEWEEQQNALGRTCLKQDEYDRATMAMTRLSLDKSITELIECSRKQVMCVADYHDKETGQIVPCKVLLDLVPGVAHPMFGKVLADFKTDRCAHPFPFAQTVRKRNYHVQAAFHTDVYVAATGEDRTDWLLAIQENLPPYETGRRLLSQAAVDLGRVKYLNALKSYCHFLATGKAAGYDDTGDWTMVDADSAMEMDAIRSTPDLPAMDEEEAEPEYADVPH